MKNDLYLNHVLQNQNGVLTGDQIRRTREALIETMDMRAKWESRNTFCESQEAERKERLAFCERHISKLQGMMAAV